MYIYYVIKREDIMKEREKISNELIDKHISLTKSIESGQINQQNLKKELKDIGLLIFKLHIL